MKISVMLHLLGVIVWVGGMFFAYLVLRPSAAQVLDAGQRLMLWAVVLGRFFFWVWISVALILGSGFQMISVISELGRVPWHVYAMLYTGVLMTLIFAYVYVVPYAALRRLVSEQNWTAGAAALARIRVAVGINLALGLANVLIATIGAM